MEYERLSRPLGKFDDELNKIDHKPMSRSNARSKKSNFSKKNIKLVKHSETWITRTAGDHKKIVMKSLS